MHFCLQLEGRVPVCYKQHCVLRMEESQAWPALRDLTAGSRHAFPGIFRAFAMAPAGHRFPLVHLSPVQLP